MPYFTPNTESELRQLMDPNGNPLVDSSTRFNGLGQEYSTFTGANIKALIVLKSDSEAIRVLRGQISDTIKGEDLDPANYEALNRQFTADSYQALGRTNPKVHTLPIINLQSITCSTFRNKSQVRALGSVAPRGFARGSRTLAGTMIITEFDRDVFWKILTTAASPTQFSNGDFTKSILIDQIAPFNIVLLFLNEFGFASYRYIYDVEIITNGIVYSIQDMYNENTLSFMASDITPLTPMETLHHEMQAGYAKIGFDMVEARAMSGAEVVRRYRAAKAAQDNTR